ncbi:MAG: ATP-binding protein [Lachnospiraceae bacterium]
MKSKKYAVIDEKQCVACGECSFSCRKKAVSIKRGCFAFVEKDICIGCGLCAKNCPAGCITLIEWEER